MKRIFHMMLTFINLPMGLEQILKENKVFSDINKQLCEDIKAVTKVSTSCLIDPLTPGTFCHKRISWTFWRFSD